MALIRQVLVVDLIRKEIEHYGVLKLTARGRKFIENPTSFMMTEDHVYATHDDGTITSSKR